MSRIESRFGVAESSRDRGTLPEEIAFLTRFDVSEAVLRRAADLAAREGVSAERALLAYGLVDADMFYRTLARHLDVPFVKHWPALDPTTDPTRTVITGTMRLGAQESRKILAAPTGDALRRLLAARDDRKTLAALALTTPDHLVRLVGDRFGAAMAYAATHALPDAAPRLSARGKFDRNAGCLAGAAIGATLYGGWFDWHAAGDLLGLVFLGGMILRVVVCVTGLGAPLRDRATIDDAAAPSYTVLVPLYDEPTVVPDLVAALKRLDYPRAKLEILILLEADDAATHDALHAQGLPAYIRIVVAPDGMPRTKPRALNVGLSLARGDLLCVYDAEDRPDPRQLRQAAALFDAAGPHVACLQARLAIANGTHGLLPRLFAIEYASLFDVFNVGIARLRFPMALGGTSNHFRTAVLRGIGGWDAWNVTEDADLGFRLARFGYATHSLASTTLEDAPEKRGVWFRQRRRWMKGWMQTLVVLARDPTVLRDFGPWRTCILALLLTNLVTGPLALPYFQLLMICRFVVWGAPRPTHVFEFGEAALAIIVMSTGVASTLWCGYQGVLARRLHVFVWALPLLPLYQTLISAATWAACFDLVRNPYHWHKTEHGAARSPTTTMRPSRPAPGHAPAPR